MRDLGCDRYAVGMNAGIQEENTRAAREAIEWLGGHLDILVCNASVQVVQEDVLDITPAQARDTLLQARRGRHGRRARNRVHVFALGRRARPAPPWARDAARIIVFILGRPLVKRLLLSTAILGAATVPVLAQDQSNFREAPDAMEIRASDFMGMRVYATEAAVDGEEFEGVQEGWEDIGEINDIVMDRDGSVQAVLVDIGGFLGIGERTVAVTMDALRFVSDSATAEEADDFFLVMNANREAFEAAPEYMDQQNGEMTAEQAATETEQAIENGGENVAAAVGTAAGSAIEGTENAGEAIMAETGEAAEGVENAVEETGEEIADAGAEVADEAADAGQELSEEVAQIDMTDTQEDQAEIADANADAMEETGEEAVQATAEATDEAADQTEMAAEATMTETEMATEETAEVAAAEQGELTTADTQEEVIVSNVPAGNEAAIEGETEGEVANTELTSAETQERAPLIREGFVVAGAEDMTADRLQGAGVYDANDERVGEVGEIILSADGQVQQLVIDVGGFLGIGEKPVALEMSSLDILRQDGGEEIRVFVSQTEEDLETLERYEAE